MAMFQVCDSLRSLSTHGSINHSALDQHQAVVECKIKTYCKSPGKTHSYAPGRCQVLVKKKKKGTESFFFQITFGEAFDLRAKPLVQNCFKGESRFVKLPKQNQHVKAEARTYLLVHSLLVWNLRWFFQYLTFHIFL